MSPSLFDRIAHGAPAARADEDESIRLHLLRMLTTRQGSVQALPGYGLPDLNDVNLTKSEIFYMSSRAIEKCIALYEPRLENVRVSAVDAPGSPFALQFSISAMKRGADGALSPWGWHIELDGNGVKQNGAHTPQAEALDEF